MNELPLFFLLSGALLTASPTLRVVEGNNEFDKFTYVAYWILFAVVAYGVLTNGSSRK